MFGEGNKSKMDEEETKNGKIYQKASWWSSNGNFALFHPFLHPLQINFAKASGRPIFIFFFVAVQIGKKTHMCTEIISIFYFFYWGFLNDSHFSYSTLVISSLSKNDFDFKKIIIFFHSINLFLCFTLFYWLPCWNLSYFTKCSPNLIKIH